eukprot:1145246-Pelagomonas_calceolata.AAC.2
MTKQENIENAGVPWDVKQMFKQGRNVWKERKTTLAKPGLHSGKSFKLIPYKRQACPFELDHRPFPGLHPICSVQTQAQLMEANLSP